MIWTNAITFWCLAGIIFSAKPVRPVLIYLQFFIFSALCTGGPAADAHLPLVVRIASQDNAVHSRSNTMSLQVPNRLLYSWYQNNTVSSEYVPLVNSVIPA